MGRGSEAFDQLEDELARRAGHGDAARRLFLETTEGAAAPPGDVATGTDRLMDRMRERLDPALAEEKVPYPEYADDPEGFIRDVLGVEFLTDEQQEICRRVRDNPETTVQAGHGVGKSFIAAALVIWWVFCVGGLAISTAPTKALVNDVLWSEIRELYDQNEHRLGGERTKTRLYLTESARAYGYTARKRGRGVAFGGRHEAKMLGVQDEASGIETPIDEAFDSLLTGGGNKALRIGNPLDETSPFGSVHCKKEGAVKIPVWTHPNVAWAYEVNDDGVHVLKPEVDEKLPRDEDGNVAPESEWPEELPRSKVKGAVSVQWIEKTRNTTGRGPGTIYWQQRLNAEFADNPVESLVPRSWFKAARARWDRAVMEWESWREGVALATDDPLEVPDEYDDEDRPLHPLERAAKHRWQHGMDVGDGQDPHVMASRRGPFLMHARMQTTKGDMEDKARAVALAREVMAATGRGPINVDRYGPGSGVIENLRDGKLALPGDDEPKRVRAYPVIFGDKAMDPDLYRNVRAEAFWRLRQMFEEGEIMIAPLGADLESRLQEELAAIEYRYTPSNKIKIQPKDQIRSKLGRSTDVADAVAYAFYAMAEMEITAGGYGADEL